MTGKAEINFGGARELYPSLDQMNKVKTKDSKRFSGRNREFKQFFRPISGIQAVFPAENR